MDGKGGVELPRYMGLVKKIVPSHEGKPGHGFIDCAETRSQFGRDVFLHDKLAQKLHVGQPICFSVSINSQGMPQAVECQTEESSLKLPPSSSAQAGMGPSHSMGGCGTVPTGQRLYEVLGPEVGPAIANGMGQAAAAALISAAEQLGIANDVRMQLMATVPKDNAVSLGAFGKGPSGYDWGKGGKGPSGYDSKGSSGYDYGKGSTGYDWGKGGGKDSSYGYDSPYGGYDSKGSSYGKTGGGKPSYSDKGAPYAAKGGASDGLGGGRGGTPQPGGPYEGSVKSLKAGDPSTGAHPHGFIECDETRQLYGRDVFLHSQQADELVVGSLVHFEVMLNTRGMPQAHNLIKFS